MSTAALLKLLVIGATVALGWLAGRLNWLGPRSADPARVLSNAAFYLFVPALLFRTMSRIDLAAMPWPTLLAYFVPAIGTLLAVYAWHRLAAARLGPAAPATRAIGATYGNAVQLGIPMAAAIFGETGLALHIALVSLHVLLLLTLTTTLVELDLARASAGGSIAATLRATVRNTVIHPVVLPVLAGLAWNLAGGPLPAVLDEVLRLLSSAVAPVCLVLIGASLAGYGVGAHLRGALLLCVLKLLVLPLVVLLVAHHGFGLRGQPLAVLALMAALPVGANALVFAQRYGTLQAETTAAIVVSTCAFAATAPLWLALATRLGG